MTKKLTILWILAATLLATAAAQAETPDGTWRLFGLQANPTSEFSGTVEGIPMTIEADSATGIGSTYEVRTSALIGIEFGLILAEFDFQLAAEGRTMKFGSALMMPLTFGVNFHVIHGRKVGLHLGPVASYTLWGNLETEVGTAELDGSFDVGANLGLDVSIGSKGWGVYVGVMYLPASASDASLEIGVDPLMVQLGFAKSF